MNSISGQKRPLRQQPKNPSRRSKEEREALEREANERRKQQLDAAAADAEVEAARRNARERERAGAANRGRDRTSNIHFRSSRGRGGFMSASSRPVAPALPAAPIPEEVASKEQGLAEQPKSLKSRSTTRNKGSKSKKEPAIKEDPDGDLSMLDHADSRKTRIDGGYISSDPDEEGEGPRAEITAALLLNAKDPEAVATRQDDVEDDDEEGEPVRRWPSRGEKPTESAFSALVPVRISRKPHTDRIVIINQESATPALAEGRHHVIDKRNIKDESSRRKNSRSKDVEIISESKPFQGVYQDEDGDALDSGIKNESEYDGTEDRDMDRSQAKSRRSVRIIDNLSDRGPAQSVTQLRKGRHNRSSDSKATSQKFASIEEELEWEAWQNDLQMMKEELGPQPTISSHVKTSKGKHKALDEPTTVGPRADNVYLFQLPPIMPDLRSLQTAKKEPSSPEATKLITSDGKEPFKSSNAENPIKIEDDALLDSSATSRCRKLSLAPGRVGKLRIHQSGRATLDWGGTSFELGMGMDASFLQTAVLAKVETHEEGVNRDNFSGDAISFGQIRGKFVVTPDLKEMIGS